MNRQRLPSVFSLVAAVAVVAAQSAVDTKNWTSAQDHQNMMDQLGIKALRPGPSGKESEPNHANYDEAAADLGMPVAIESIELFGTGCHAGRRQMGVRIQDRCDNAVLHLAVIAQSGIEAALALTGLIGKLENRSVVRVRAGDDGLIDAGLILNPAANPLEGSFRRRAAEVQAYYSDSPRPRLDYQRIGIKRIENAIGKRIVPIAIAPHRD